MKYTPVSEMEESFSLSFASPVFIVSAVALAALWAALARYVAPESVAGLLAIASKAARLAPSATLYSGDVAYGTVLVLYALAACVAIYAILALALGKKRMRGGPKGLVIFALILAVTVIPAVLASSLLTDNRGKEAGGLMGTMVMFEGWMAVLIGTLALAGPPLFVETLARSKKIRIRTFYTVLSLGALGVAGWYGVTLALGEASWPLPVPDWAVLLSGFALFLAAWLASRFAGGGLKEFVYLRPVRFVFLLAFLALNLTVLHHARAALPVEGLAEIALVVLWSVLAFYGLTGLAGDISVPIGSESTASGNATILRVWKDEAAFNLMYFWAALSSLALAVAVLV